LCGGRRRRGHGGLRSGSGRRCYRHGDEDDNIGRKRGVEEKKSMLLIPCKDKRMSAHT